MNNTICAPTNHNYSNRTTYSNINSEERIRRNKIRRQRIVRRQFALLVFFITIIIILGVFFGTTLLTDAQSDDYTPEFKYYTTVMVHEGDTITKLATQYYSDNHYTDINKYIHEVCSLNRISDSDKVKAGECLIIPYYSTEFN